MSTAPVSDGAEPGPGAGSGPGAGAAAGADALLAERARSAGEFLAGLLAAGELATVGRPGRLPEGLFPGGDPGLVRAVWDRALGVGLYAGRVSVAPRFRRDELTRLQGELDAAGFVAMGRLVGRSRALVAPDCGAGPNGLHSGCD